MSDTFCQRPNSVAHVNTEKSEVGENPSAEAIVQPIPAPLPYEVQRCVEVIERLEACRGQPRYRAERLGAMQALGVSERSLRRLQQQYRERGVEGLKRQSRADEGQLRVAENWREFIVETYRKGNRGMRQMSRAQVAKQVASHAAATGTADYPSRRTVYRILAPVIEQQEQKQKKRSIGWQGEQLHLTTKAGIEIAVEYSNQVWQCDHT